MSYQDLIPLVLIEIAGDFSLKKFANGGGMNSLMTGMVSYSGIIYFLIRSLQGSQVLLVNAAWDGLSALVESIAAIVLLGEHFHDPLQYVGIVLIIAGVFLLKIPLRKPFVFPKLKSNGS
jgi:multidrug transporter EmrE-like cation transporter